MLSLFTISDKKLVFLKPILEGVALNDFRIVVDKVLNNPRNFFEVKVVPW
jgi:hypothetical protein